MRSMARFQSSTGLVSQFLSLREVVSVWIFVKFGFPWSRCSFSWTCCLPFHFPNPNTLDVYHMNRVTQACFDHAEGFDQDRSADVALHVVILESVNASHVVHSTNNVLADQLFWHQKKWQDDPDHFQCCRFAPITGSLAVLVIFNHFFVPPQLVCQYRVTLFVGTYYTTTDFSQPLPTFWQSCCVWRKDLRAQGRAVAGWANRQTVIFQVLQKTEPHAQIDFWLWWQFGFFPPNAFCQVRIQGVFKTVHERAHLSEVV